MAVDGDAAHGPGCLELRERAAGWTHYLLGRPVHGGDPIGVCFSGGWVTELYEWSGPEHAPPFFFSLALGGGRFGRVRSSRRTARCCAGQGECRVEARVSTRVPTLAPPDVSTPRL